MSVDERVIDTGHILPNNTAQVTKLCHLCLLPCVVEFRHVSTSVWRNSSGLHCCYQQQKGEAGLQYLRGDGCFIWTPVYLKENPRLCSMCLPQTGFTKALQLIVYRDCNQMVSMARLQGVPWLIDTDSIFALDIHLPQRSQLRLLRWFVCAGISNAPGFRRTIRSRDTRCICGYWRLELSDFCPCQSLD